MKKILFILLITGQYLIGQSVELSGYVYDAAQDRRLDNTQINIYYQEALLSNLTESNRNGEFKIRLPQSGIYRLELIRPAYKRLSVQIDTEDKNALQIAIPMSRLPGYEFTGIIKKLVSKSVELGDEVINTNIEIYNHTNGKEELNLQVHPRADFGFNFERGNRYTIMIRKKGFFAKRFDVVVDTDGCIICFEGLGARTLPLIVDALTLEDQEGVVETDIPLRPIEINEDISLDNIYYDYDKWNIRADARPSLDKLVQLMRTTPIIIELGSHTDSRGNDLYNLTLSEKRAQSAIKYIISKGIASNRVSAKGYGETMLVNSCANGINCKESEHQQNRRTVFKVVKLMEGSSFDNKTLKEIIDQERASKKRLLEILREE